MQSSKRRNQSTNNKRINNGRAIQSAMPGRVKERDTKMNVQRRQKLAMTLVDQLTKKLKAENNRDIVQREVDTLMRKEIINDRDLKQLEKTIQNKIKVKTNNETLKYNLIKNSKANNFNNNFQEENIYGDNNANNNEDELDNSYMSGASDLDKFNEKSKKDRDREEKIKKYKSYLCLKEKPIRPKVEIDFSQYKNEWDAINDYNKHKYEEDLEEEKRKNWETKMRTRAHLNDQIK